MTYLHQLRRCVVILLLTVGPASQSWAATGAVVDCSDLLSRQAVRNRYTNIVRTARNAPRDFQELGIGNRDLMRQLATISFLTGTSSATVGQQAIDVSDIKSTPGIPDGDELGLEALSQILFMSNLFKQDVHLVFQHTVDFMPLLTGKIGNSEAAMALVRLSLIYNKTPAQAVQTFDEFITSSTALKAKIAEIQQTQIAQMDGLAQSLVNLVGAGSGEIPTELGLAIIEGALATRGSVTKGIQVLEQILLHEKASRYTLHEQAAMLMASVVLGQSLELSLAQLAILENGAKQRFGGSLSEMIERPSVVLILLGQQDPAKVLDMIEHVGKTGERYSPDAASAVLNKAVIDLAARGINSNLLNSAVALP